MRLKRSTQACNGHGHNHGNDDLVLITARCNALCKVCSPQRATNNRHAACLKRALHFGMRWPCRLITSSQRLPSALAKPSRPVPPGAANAFEFMWSSTCRIVEDSMESGSVGNLPRRLLTNTRGCCIGRKGCTCHATRLKLCSCGSASARMGRSQRHEVFFVILWGPIWGRRLRMWAWAACQRYCVVFAV